MTSIQVLLSSASLSLVLACFSLIAAAQDLTAPATLRAEPTPDGKVLKQLPANATVKVLKRQGFYVEVESGGAKGWLKASEVPSSKSAGGSLSNLDTGRTGKGNIVSTSAARGLSPKDVIAAKPDHQQVEELKKLGVSASAADEFAAQGGLQSRKLALLMPPQGSGRGTASSKTGPDGKTAQGSAKKPVSKKKSDEEDDDE